MKIKTVERQPPPSFFAPQPAANILRNLLMKISFAKTSFPVTTEAMRFRRSTTSEVAETVGAG
jgi:hypothetical protein